MNVYQFQRSFAADPTLKGRVFDLLETCFPGITQAERESLDLGHPWERASTPFVYWQGNVAITHVGVLEISLVMLGQTVRVGAIHAVGTRPEYRRRGYYRQVMTEVLQYCACRYNTLILTTGQPELYEPFGFRVLQEHLFMAPCASPGGRQGFWPFQPHDANALRALQRLLDQRVPVSHILGVVQERAVFSFNARNFPLYYAPDLEVVLAFTLDGTRLNLFDIVATQIPSLAAILARLPQRIDQVVTYFSPDRLGADFQAIPHLLMDSPEALGGAGADFFMVRGPWTVEDQAFMLPRSARC
jgi:predicted N-acetyltransferase YhbS